MICKKCNSTVPDSAAFCPNCGEKLSAETKNKSSSNPEATTDQNNGYSQQYQQYDQNGYQTDDQNQAYAQGYDQNQAYAQGYDQNQTYAQGYDQNQTYDAQGYDQNQTYAQGYDENQTYAQGYDENQYNTAYAAENGGFYNPNFNSAPPSGKKSSSKKLIRNILLIAVPVLVVALVVVLNFNPIAGFFIKTFGSDAAYFKYVEKNAFMSYAEDLSGFYGTAADMLDGNAYSENKIKVNVGDGAVDLIDDLADFDASFLKDLEISLSSGTKDSYTLIDAAIKVNGKLLADPSVIMDMDNEEIFLSILALSDKYMSISADGMSNSYGDAMSADMITGNSDVVAALPSEKELDSLLKKYIKIAVDNVDNISSSKETLDVDEVKESVTEIEFEFDTDNAKAICLAILEEARDDKKLEKYITEAAAALEDADYIDDADDVYDDFIDFVEEGIDSLEDNDSDNEVLFVLTDYVNSKHEVVGRKITVGEDENEILYYATAHEGDDFATEANFEGISLTGNGVDNNGKITGEFEIGYYGTTVLELSTENFNTNKIGDGVLQGTVRITPTSALYRRIGVGSDISMYGLSLADIGVELIFDTKNTEGSVTLNVLMDDDVFAGVTVESKNKKAPKVKLPSGKNTIEIESESDLFDWLETVDSDKLIKSMEKANIPDEVIDLVDEVFDEYVD